MSIIWVIEVVDHADFDAIKARKAFKSLNAGRRWGAATAQGLAEEAKRKGEEIINFDYQERGVEFVNY